MDVTPRVSFSTWSFRVEAPPDADDQFRQGARRGWMSPYDLRAGRRGAAVGAEAGTAAVVVGEAVVEAGSRRHRQSRARRRLGCRCCRCARERLRGGSSPRLGGRALQLLVEPKGGVDCLPLHLPAERIRLARLRLARLASLARALRGESQRGVALNRRRRGRGGERLADRGEVDEARGRDRGGERRGDREGLRRPSVRPSDEVIRERGGRRALPRRLGAAQDDKVVEGAHDPVGRAVVADVVRLDVARLFGAVAHQLVLELVALLRGDQGETVGVRGVEVGGGGGGGLPAGVGAREPEVERRELDVVNARALRLLEIALRVGVEERAGRVVRKDRPRVRDGRARRAPLVLVVVERLGRDSALSVSTSALALVLALLRGVSLREERGKASVDRLSDRLGRRERTGEGADAGTRAHRPCATTAQPVKKVEPSMISWDKCVLQKIAGGAVRAECGVR